MEQVLAAALRRRLRSALEQFRPVRREDSALDFDLAVRSVKNRAQIGVVAVRPDQLQHRPVHVAQEHRLRRARLLLPDLGRPGRVRAQRALHLVQRVRPPAGHTPALSCAVVVPIPPPAMLQVGVIRPQLGLVAPRVPVQTLRHGHRRARNPRLRRFEVAGDHGVHKADCALPHQLAGVNVGRDRALLRAGLQHALVLPHRLAQRDAFPYRQRERLLGVHIQARLQRAHRDQHARVRRRLDEHGIELFVLQ